MLNLTYMKCNSIADVSERQISSAFQRPEASTFTI